MLIVGLNAYHGDVAAGGERATHPGDDQAADFLILVQLPQRGVHFLAHRTGKRIEPLRPIDPDPADGPIALTHKAEPGRGYDTQAAEGKAKR